MHVEAPENSATVNVITAPDVDSHVIQTTEPCKPIIDKATGWLTSLEPSKTRARHRYTYNGTTDYLPKVSWLTITFIRDEIFSNYSFDVVVPGWSRDFSYLWEAGHVVKVMVPKI